jgi:hypothetical protein
MLRLWRGTIEILAMRSHESAGDRSQESAGARPRPTKKAVLAAVLCLVMLVTLTPTIGGFAPTPVNAERQTTTTGTQTATYRLFYWDNDWGHEREHPSKTYSATGKKPA